jgi:asparagine synthase (glutamine-hydrolysing)
MLIGVYRHSGGPVEGLSIVHRLREPLASPDLLGVEGPLAVACGPPADRATVDGISCTLDGYLYERGDLTHKLGLETASDAELIARGYRHYGEELLTRLRGRFAFVLWDGARQRGFLSSDLLATQPLFLWRGVGYLAFASELRDLLSMLPSSPGPDSVGFLHLLAGSTAPVDRTLYEGVSRLAPGQLVELVADAPTRSYWQPRYKGTLKGSREELAEGLREEIERAVARRLFPRSGVVLSGGLDSSIVTAAAARVKRPGSQLRTYSAVFPGAEYDEGWKIRSLTAALGIEPGLFELEPQGALRLALGHLKRWGLPVMGNGCLIDIAMVAAASRDGIEVVMEGQTGDEVFGCSPWLVADRLMRGRALAALAIASEWPGQPTTPRDRLKILKIWGLKGAAPYLLHRLARSRRDPDDFSRPWLLPALRSRYAEVEDAWAWKAGVSGPRWWRYQADRLVRAPIRELRLDYLRHRALDAGILSETPLYDFDLIDFSLRLPPQLAFDSAFDRPLAREAMRGLIPDDVRLNGNKAVFSPFCYDMLTGADAPGIERLLTAPDAELGAYVDTEHVRRLWNQERPTPGAGRATMSWGTDMWTLAMAECWLRSQANPGFVDEMLARPDVPRPRVRPSAGAATSTFLEPTFSGLVKAPGLT